MRKSTEKQKSLNLDKDKQKLINLIGESDSFIVLFMEDNNKEVAHYRYNISNADVITACEVVKFNTLKKVTKGK